MLKIKNYFIKHPKLKKLTKIIGIIFIVFSFLFNAVIIASAIITSYKDNIKHPLVYDSLNKVNITSPIHKAVSTTDGHYFLSNADLQFNTFYSNIIEKFGDIAKYDNFNTFQYSTSNGYLTLDNIDVSVYDTGDMLEYNTQFDVTQIDLSKSIFQVAGVDNILYTISFKYTQGNSTNTLNFNYLVYVNCSFFGLTTKGVMIYQSYNVNDEYYNQYHVYLTLYPDYGIFYELFVKNSDKGYVNGYIDGYATGLTTGKDVGYAEGYQAGIDYAGAHSMTSDPFTLISRAFSSLASILNIEVLPNLTLGVLIFTPLIVTIIVVVVKFMRG